MKTKIWYSIQNGGDGSAYPNWFESQELAEIDQETMVEGWAENCSGFIEIESDGPIKFLEDLKTVEDVIKEAQEELADYEKYEEKYKEQNWYKENIQQLNVKLDRLKELKDLKDANTKNIG